MIKFFENIEIYGTGSTSSGTAIEVKNSGSTSLFKIKNDGFIGINLTGTPTAQVHIDRNNDGQHLLKLTSDGYNILSSRLGGFDTTAVAHTFDGIGGGTFTFIADTNPYLIWNLRSLGETLNIGGSIPTITTTRPTFVIDAPLVGIGESYPAVSAKLHVKGATSNSSAYGLKITDSASTEILTVRNDGKVLIQTLTAGLGGGNVSTNTTFGTNALASNTTGFQNTAIGNGSLNTNTTASGNTAVGYGTLTLNGGSGGGHDNTAIGNQAMVFNNTATANFNTAVGSGALKDNTSGWENTAIGYKAGNNTDIPFANNSIGRFNTWVGAKACGVGNAGDDVYNTTVIGYSGNARGNSSIVVGANSVAYSATSIVVGSASSTIGTNSVVFGSNSSVVGTNSMALGNNISIATDNVMVLGTGVNVGIGTSSPTDKLSIYTAKTATSTSTPDSINLGGTYSNAAGTNLKFKIYDDGGSIGGFGISSGQLDYKSWSTGADHVFYADTNKIMTIKGTGEVNVGMTSGSHKLNVNGNIGLSGISQTYNIGTYEVLKISQGSGAPNISLGNNNTLVDADNGGGIVVGSSSLAASDGIAIGLNTSAYTGTVDAIAIGRSATVSNGSIRGVAIGREASVTASNAFAIGNYTTASQDDTIILGNNISGNKPKVGIGFSTPSATLDISGNTSSSLLRLNNSNFSFANKLLVSNDGSFYTGSINGFGQFGTGTFTTDQLTYALNTSYSTYLAFSNNLGAGNMSSYGIIGGPLTSADTTYRLSILNNDSGTLGNLVNILSTSNSTANDGTDYYSYGIKLR